MDNKQIHARRRASVGLGLAALLLATAGSLFARETSVEAWPLRSRTLVRALVEEYGIPNRLNEVEVVWYDNGPWRKTVVHRDSWSRLLGIRDNDNLEQIIGYRVPGDKIRSLKRFGRRIEFDKAGGELSSRAESQGLNYMALNLANEIITGTRTVEDARDFYRKTEELSKAGKSSPYLEGFLFTVEPNAKAVRPE